MATTKYGILLNANNNLRKQQAGQRTEGISKTPVVNTSWRRTQKKRTVPFRKVGM